MSEEVAQTAGISLAGAGVRRIALAVDMLIGHLVEFIGAMLVLAETCILFAGVVSRYFYVAPTFLACPLRGRALGATAPSRCASRPSGDAPSRK